MKTTIIIPIAAGLIGAAAGFYGGFVIGGNKRAEEVWAIAEDEINSMEDMIKRRYKVAEYAEPLEYHDVDGESVLTVPGGVDPEDLEKLAEHINGGGYASLSDLPRETIINSFVQYGDKKVELRDIHETTVTIEDVSDTGNPNRDDPEPIIITELEYAQDEEDYDKLSVSWFPGDRVLVDSTEQPIEDVEGTVGINNLNELSLDHQTTIFVRNRRLQQDYEIALEVGTYRETVLGEEDVPVMERPRRKPRARVDTDE